MGLEGLDFRVVPIAFTQGQDTRTQPKLVLPGKWQELVNYSVGIDNTPKRRDGSRVLVEGTVGNGLATHQDELLVINGNAVSSYSPLQGAAHRVSGAYANVDVAADNIVPPSGVNDGMDCASSGTATLYVWVAGAMFGSSISPTYTRDSVNCMLVDETTGTVLLNTVLRTDHNVRTPRVVYDSNGAFYVFYESSTGANALYCTVITTVGVVGTEVALVTSASLPIANFDVCYFPQNSVTHGVLVAYRWNDGVRSARAIQVTRTGTVPAISGSPLDLTTAAAIPTANIRGVAVVTYVSGRAGVFILQDTGTPGISGVIINTSFLVAVGPTVIYAFAMVAGESHITATRNALGSGGDYMQVFSDQMGAYGTSALKPISTVMVDGSLNIISAGATLARSASYVAGGACAGPQGPWIYGKAFTSSTGSVFLPCMVIETYATLGSGTCVNVDEQNTFFLLDGNTGFVMAKALYGSFGVTSVGGNPTVSTPCSSSGVGSSFILPVPVFGPLQLIGPINYTQIGIARVTLTPNSSRPPIHCQLGKDTFFAGGVLTGYDGLKVVEHGFNLFPEGIGTATAGAGLCTAGVHQVVVVAEWTDASGLRHQSSPSPAVTIDTTAAPNIVIQVSIPSLILTQKSNVTFTAFMTTAAGTIFYRTGAPGVANNPASNITTYDISITDTVLASSEALYAQPDQGGSTLPNDAPPPCKAICASQNRLWLLPSDNALEYRYSQALLNGFGLQFSGLYGDSTLGGLVPSDSGGTVTIAPLDEKTVIFCTRKLYVIFGGAPDASGNNNTLSGPEEIPSPVGCSDALSVLRIPSGLMFKADSGWYLLGRDLSVTYIGDGAADFDTYSVLSATLMQDRQECRFELLSPTIATEGITLVFAYLEGQWSVFQRGSDLSHPVGARDALWYAPLEQYVWLCQPAATPAGGLFADVPGLYSEFSNTASESVIPTRAVTAWLRPATLNGFQRVRRLYLSGTGNGTNTSLAVAIDFDDVPGRQAPGAYTATVVIDSTTVGMEVNGIIDLRHKLHRQKCKSVQFTFTDTPLGTDLTPMVGIQTMALEIGFRRGVWKLAAASTF